MLAWISQALASSVARLANATAPKLGPVAIPAQVVDMRAQAAKESNKSYGRRKWSRVTGVCLHQTACVLGERNERWLNVGCHVGITRSGKILWLHDFDKLVIHGHGWNAQTVGFEIDGLYAGIQGDPRTVWDDRSTPQHEQGMSIRPEQMDAARVAVRWVYDTIASRWGKMRALVAHRQSTDDRRTDPGSAIWQAVALPLHKELGLSDGGPGFVLGKGQPIPEAWDPSRIGIKY